ncbi:hypothetical protein AX16_007011 [Volvariella volvacea WC 439]|nr:hypothetical protein AX16_007011 [Volvariella volvacea WC 439]
MLAFIQSQPDVVERILQHVEVPPFVDLLVRIIQLDEQPGGEGVLEWLSSQNLIGRLVDLLSPEHSSDVHMVVSDLIKGIISMAAPSPGAGMTEGLQHGPGSNQFTRELAQRSNIEKMVSYILGEWTPSPPKPKKQDDGRDRSRTNPSGYAFDRDDHFHFNSDHDHDHDTVSVSEPENHQPTPESTSSSIVNSVCIIIELIRKNNSDYFEPYLFHTLRNRLITVQQHLRGGDGEENRATLEKAMKEMVDRMGVVHLGPLLDVMCDKAVKLQEMLKTPNVTIPISTTVGPIQPLTFERYRLCELFAELLHCSGMGLVNRAPRYDHLYDSLGRLQGGLSGLEELAQVISINGNGSADHEAMDEVHDEIELEPALELPVTQHQAQRRSSSLSHDRSASGTGANSSASASMELGSSPLASASSSTLENLSMDGESGGEDIDDDSDMNSDDVGIEEIAMYDEHEQAFSSPTFNSDLPLHGSSPALLHSSQSQSRSSPLQRSPTTGLSSSPSGSNMNNASVSPSSPSLTQPALSSSPPDFSSAQGAALTRVASRQQQRSDSTSSTGSGLGVGTASTPTSRKNSRKHTVLDDKAGDNLPVGERLKHKLLSNGLLGILLDLFFEFPWNNFLHGTVYDFVHQILTGHVESGLNRELAISLFRDAKLIQRIIEGQKKNDVEAAKPKGVRLGYMGHLTLLAEDVVMALERYPPDLRIILSRYVPEPDWEHYVKTRYFETKKKDSQMLGGGKPVIGTSTGGSRGGVSSWKVDEDMMGVETYAPASGSATDAFESLGSDRTRGEFRRAGDSRLTRANTADFGPAPMEEDDDDDFDPSAHGTFAQYLAQEIHGSGGFGESESDDDDEEEGGWLAHSNFPIGKQSAGTASLNQSTTGQSASNSSSSTRGGRRGFDDAFEPTSTASHSMADDLFSSSDDDGFGPFSDNASVSSDPFNFASGLDDMDDASFDSFGDFGEFQSASTFPSTTGSAKAPTANSAASATMQTPTRGSSAQVTPTSPTSPSSPTASFGSHSDSATNTPTSSAKSITIHSNDSGEMTPTTGAGSWIFTGSPSSSSTSDGFGFGFDDSFTGRVEGSGTSQKR